MKNQNNYENTNWADGNNVPVATIVIGNRVSEASTSYPYGTSVELNNVVFDTPDTSKGGNTYYDIYLYQNKVDQAVVVTGTIKNASDLIVNDSRNGAKYDVKEAADGGDSAEDLQTLADKIVAMISDESVNFAENPEYWGGSEASYPRTLTKDYTVDDVTIKQGSTQNMEAEIIFDLQVEYTGKVFGVKINSKTQTMNIDGTEIPISFE